MKLVKTVRVIAAPLMLALLLAACTGEGNQPNDSAPASDPPAAGEPRLVVTEGPIEDPGISVEEAFDHQPTDDIVAVTGALFADPDGTVRLCDAIAESFPPQCAGASIVVEGLDLQAVSGLQTEGDVSWAEGVTILGSVE